MESAIDRGWVLVRHRFGPHREVAPFDGDVRFALVSVNASTTHYLQLMLCTLAEQSHLGLVHRVVLVDNKSRDGGTRFLRDLAAAVPRVHLVENRAFLNHARGIRSGIRALDRVERELPAAQQANVLLFVDPDVVFLRPTALADLAVTMLAFDAAMAGEVRERAGNPHPNIQASFLAVRREVAARRDVRPWINSGQPAFDLQWSVVQAGLPVADFPGNAAGHLLHRGRAAVEAAGTHTPWRSYAGVADTEPHYMGVPGGQELWGEVEARCAERLRPGAEPALVASLSAAFERLGTPVDL